jgi:tetratricopeptide (TPR) repeat protein
MNHSLNKIVSQAATGISLGTIALFPVFMLPFTTNYFEFNKLALLIVAVSLLALCWIVDTVNTKTLRLHLSPFALPLLGYGLYHFASSFFMTPNTPAEALMSRGTLFFALALFVVLTDTMVDNRRFIKNSLYALIGSGTVLGIIALFQSFGFGLSNLINQIAGTTLANTLAFSPAGSSIALLTFLAPILVLALFLAFTKTDTAEKVSLFVLSAIMSAALVVTLIFAFPGKDTAPIFLPFSAGYNVAIETLKTPKTALLGVGTNSFAAAYNQFRPISMNTGDFWNIRFTASTSELLQIVTTVGAIGLGLFIWVITTMAKVAKVDLKSTQAKAIKIVSFGLLLFFILMPGTYTLFFAFYICLLLWGLHIKFSSVIPTKELSFAVEENTTKPQTLKMIGVFTPVVLVIAAIGATGFFGGRAYAAEITFKNALDAAAKNDGLATYNLERQAIMLNAYVPRYRRAYAATNLALANSIASNKDITDQDKQNVAQLIQQAIREGKVAASLEPENVNNWENLTLIYRSLINAAEGADQWTVAALSQAIQTDPTNPSLRIDLGGVYYSLGRYDQAIRLFQQAAELKSDYANAYYNLSHSYLQKKDVVSAYDYMQQTLSLTKADSADYTKAKQELEELSKQLPKTEATKAQSAKEVAPAKTQLQAPSPAPSPTTGVTLPQGSGPENATQTTPTTPSTDIKP